jgi:hypothetical protein
MMSIADAVAVLEILQCNEDPIYVHGNQTTIDALYDSQSIEKFQDATQLKFEFYAHHPTTRVVHRVSGSLYAMVFDRMTFTG